MVGVDGLLSLHADAAADAVAEAVAFETQLNNTNELYLIKKKTKKNIVNSKPEKRSSSYYEGALRKYLPLFLCLFDLKANHLLLEWSIVVD